MAVPTATLNDGLASYSVATTIHVRIELTSDITPAELRAKLIEERGETSLTSPRPLSRCSIVLTELRERLAAAGQLVLRDRNLDRLSVIRTGMAVPAEP